MTVTFTITPMSVAQGLVTGFSTVQQVGRNPSVGPISEDVWDAGLLSTLDYDGLTGSFTAGLTITQTVPRLATATIVIDDNAGAVGTLTIRKITGDFVDNETFTDGSGIATSNGIPSSIRGMVYPTAGEQWEIICESADDTFTGIGARQILVSYLDDTFTPKVEIVESNGHVGAPLDATDAFRPKGLAVLDWGSQNNVVHGPTNLGSVVLRHIATGNIRAMIQFDDSNPIDKYGLNNSFSSHFTVPAGNNGFIQYATTNTTRNHSVTVQGLLRLDGIAGFSTGGEVGSNQDSFIQDTSAAPLQGGFPAKTDFKLVAHTKYASAAIVNVQISGFLVDSDLVTETLYQTALGF